MQLRSVLGALVFFLAAPAQAMVAPPTDATPGTAEAAVRSHVRAGLDGLLEELQRFTDPQVQVIAETTALIGELNQGVGRALQLRNKGATAEAAAAWHKPWASGVEARMRTLQSSAAALPAFDEAKLTLLLGANGGPALRSAYRSLPDQLRTLVEGNNRLGRQVLALAGSAAGGNAQAGKSLVPFTLRLNASALEAENAYMKIAMLGVELDHPQYFLLKSMVGSNEAVRKLMTTQSDVLSGAQVDKARSAQELADLARAAQDAASAIEPAAAAMLAAPEMKDFAALAPEAHAKLQAAARSYGESAAVELQISEVIARAGNLMRAEAPDWAAIAKALAPVQTLVERRAALDNERRAALTR